MRASSIIFGGARNLELDFTLGRLDAIMNANDLSLLNTKIKELKKEVSTLKIERKALIFMATCGISYAVLQFAPLASAILLVVSFSFCFLENIIKGEQ